MEKTAAPVQTHRVTGDADAFLTEVEPFRRELQAHCYRMSGSAQDAEDLVQESLIKAWKNLQSFEGRSSLRRWLYSVATRTCLDALDAKKSRVLLTGAASDPALPPGPPPDGVAWLEPYPDEALPSDEPTPEARYTQKESVALAFLAALQLLPAKQRAVLLLRDVLGWQATECAELLELSVAAVNSALQRARETLATKQAQPSASPDASLLQRYVDAWASSDSNKLVALLHEDALAAMPPLALWLDGAHAIAAFLGRFVMPPGSAGTFRMAPVHANGQSAFVCFANGAPVALHVLAFRADRIARLDAFTLPTVVRRFAPLD